MKEHSLKTQRLTLRSIKRKDSDELFRILSTYPDICQYMTSKPPQSVEEILDSIEKTIASDDIKLAVCLEGILIGVVTLRNFHWWQQESNKASAFLSFWISPEHGGKGYGTEMLREICRFGFEDLGLRKIFAGTFSQNIPSQKILGKIGFHCIGTLRDHYIKDDIHYDSIRYELLSEHFLKINPPLITPPGEKEDRPYLPAPFKIIRSPHITLRSVKISDTEDFFELTNTYPEISRYMTWNVPTDLEDTKYKCVFMRREGDINIAITNPSGTLVGKATLRNFRFQQQEAIKNSAFLSYWFAPRWDTHETAQEFLHSICKYGFKTLGLRKIIAGIFAENTKTASQLEQFGFVLIGRLQKHYVKNNIEHDSLRYEIIPSDISL